MNEAWRLVARRAVQGLDVRRGELVQVRDHAGRAGVLQEVLFAIEAAGATPLPEITPPTYLKKLLREVDSLTLADWDRHRLDWMEQIDRILVLQGMGLNPGDVPAEALDAWSNAVNRITLVEEERHLPYLLVAIPTEERAEALGMTLQTLEERVLPALSAPVDALQREIEGVLEAVRGSQAMTIYSGDGYELHLQLSGRRWLADDGLIETEERIQGAVVSNLPGGSVYTTVIESETRGSIWLPGASAGSDVVLNFEGGCIVDVEASQNAEAFTSMLKRHTGDCERVGHIGIGLNPRLRQPVGGWTIVDEHVYGALFLSLGENRYMGGENASSLNVDYAIPGATLVVDGRTIVDNGQVLPQ
jgi:leucyl aminopeptidase (aminopeptidase T)